MTVTLARMTLSEPQKKYLRGLGHHLKPVIVVGDRGLSESVIKEFESTINHHELIKVRVRAGDRESRDEIIVKLCDPDTSLVTRIGNVALLFRRNTEKPRVNLPRR
jgi:RNA-binding protein